MIFFWGGGGEGYDEIKKKPAGQGFEYKKGKTGLFSKKEGRMSNWAKKRDKFI